MKKMVHFFLIVSFISLLTGCMYPEEELAKNQTPYVDQINAVQSAVEQYQKDSGGLLPIKTKEANTPVFQKYPIDFEKIVPRYMAEPPGNAFESGGIFQYVLINEETNPTVKLIDLRHAETIRDIKIRLQTQEFPPTKRMIDNNVFLLDYKQLGFKKEPTVVSPFTKQNLSFVMDGQANIYVDYRSDLYAALKKTKHAYKHGDDITSILTENSYFVPAFSLPYTVDEKTKEPIFLTK